MQEIITRMTHMNFETASTVILVGCVEVLLGVAVYKILEKNNMLFEKIDLFVEDYILEPFVGLLWLENRICSYRLGEKDIEAMSKKGYKIFDGDKGRFVREIPEVLKRRMEW